MIAKSYPIETIEEHTNHLIEGLKELKDLYGNKFTDLELELIELAATFHDCGKSNFCFQKMMREKIKVPFTDKEIVYRKEIERMYDTIKDGDKIPHGYLSPSFLDLTELEKEYGKANIKILINAIYYHHTREYSYGESQIKTIVDEDLKRRVPNKLQTRYINKIYSDKSPIEDDEWIKFACVKGMLNKLDYWASSDRKEKIEINPEYNNKSIGEIIEHKIRSKNWDLREVQTFMKENKDKNLVVVASTGIGKTEAALLWIDIDKAFYTLPLKVSINAIYDRIKKEYRYPKEKVSLLHSDALSYLIDKENYDSVNKYFLTRNFAFPLTVCTVDQLFTFVYKYRGSEILLSTLKYSKLIIDEVQAYSPEIIGKLIYGLKLITEAGGKFSIITATMPPIFEYFMKKQGIEYYKPPKVYLSPNKSRHYIYLTSGEFDYDEISEVSSNSKVLIICNTVNKAQEVYDCLKSLNAYLLHARFAQNHKSMLEDEILKFTSADNKLPGVWITTQIVEASLDIDFDMLYTEMCTADSLLQRMGRCYRKRDYLGNKPNVKIYDTRNGVGKNPGQGVYDAYLYDRSLKFLEQYSNRIFLEEEKITYINYVYDIESLLNENFADRINKTIKECRNIVPGIYDSKDAKNKFREISAVTLIPDDIYNQINANGYLNDLIKTSQNNQLKYSERLNAQNIIKGYTVNVSYNIRKRDYNPIQGTKDIFRTLLKYEFNEKDLKGRGLLNQEEKEDVSL